MRHERDAATEDVIAIVVEMIAMKTDVERRMEASVKTDETTDVRIKSSDTNAKTGTQDVWNGTVHEVSETEVVQSTEEIEESKESEAGTGLMIVIAKPGSTIAPIRRTVICIVHADTRTMNAVKTRRIRSLARRANAMSLTISMMRRRTTTAKAHLAMLAKAIRRAMNR